MSTQGEGGGEGGKGEGRGVGMKGEGEGVGGWEGGIAGGMNKT